MVNFIDTLLITIILFIVWITFSLLILIHIRLVAKKKWRKNKESYPYFNYPFYKKIFLFGLKGALNPTVVVFTVILNISVILIVALGVWNLISQNIYISYILRAAVGLYGISFFLKSVFYIAFPLKF